MVRYLDYLDQATSSISTSQGTVTGNGSGLLAEVHERNREGNGPRATMRNSALGGEDSEMRGDISAELHLYVAGRARDKVGLALLNLMCMH